jgi:toxin ParE1/3/4
MWYDQYSTQLGEKFLKALNKSISLIERNPKMFPLCHGRMRRALLPTFPFQVVYEFDSGEVIVYAVFHGARDPEELKKRLG